MHSFQEQRAPVSVSRRGEEENRVDISVLNFQQATKAYPSAAGEVQALKAVSLQVPAGSFVALMGRSGCGKSTLLNLAGAMDFPTTGKVLLDGVVTGELRDAQLTQLRREKVGFIFQAFQLISTLSVLENVELPLLLAGKTQTRSRVMEQLASVGLEQQADRLPYQLSGGQMQRVAIARALVHAPRLLLADEPTGNLDSTTGDSILQLLRAVSEERRATILMATHSAEAAAYANTVVHMRDGRIEQVSQN